MKDSEVEDLLRNYRPVGPPAALRQRILATTRTPRIWPWSTAAAALLMLGVTFQIAARNETATAEMNLGRSTIARVVEDLADMLGGDFAARELAELIVVEQQLRSVAPSVASESVKPSGEVQR